MRKSKVQKRTDKKQGVCVFCKYSEILFLVNTISGEVETSIECRRFTLPYPTVKELDTCGEYELAPE